MRRYGLSRPELQRLLDRNAAEGRMERMPGYGWRFTETLSSAEAYEQSLAFRAVIKPAAIMQAGYRLPEQPKRSTEHEVALIDQRHRRLFTGFRWSIGGRPHRYSSCKSSSCQGLRS